MIWRHRDARASCPGKWPVLLAVLLWSWLGASTLAGQPPQPGLNWVRLPGAEACISAHELAVAVEERLERPIFGAPATGEIFVDGVVEPSPEAPGGFVARIWVNDATGRMLGQRELASAEPNCRSLDEALILVIAVTLYPQSELMTVGVPLDRAVSEQLDALFHDDPSELSPDDAPAIPSQGSATRGQEHASERMAPEPGTRRGQAPTGDGASPFGVDLTALAGAGVLPALSAGIGARLFAEMPVVGRLELGANLWAPTTVDSSGGAADFSRMSAELLACPIAVAWLFGARPCLGVRTGLQGVEARGFVHNAPPKRHLLVEVVAQLLLRRPITGPLHYRLAVSIGIPLVRRDYTYSTDGADDGVVYQALGGNGRLEVGLGWDF